MSLSPEFLDELRARVPVSEIVGRKVQLKRRGREHIGLCPFHQDSKPSLNVVDDKGFYHCFACQAHGDVITFVMETEGLSFPEAVESLCERAGLEMPRQDPESREKEERRRTLHDAAEAACRFYEDCLRAPEGREARAYLDRRGLSEETIRRFRLGYAPGRRGALRAHLEAAGVSLDQMVEAGLVKRSEDGRETYDYLRDRVIFPITDRRGRPIAFGGRVLGDAQPKYLNSPDGPLFHKGRVLYGLAQAREAAAKAGEVIAAEGYMDVIALAQAGFPQAVAPLGTAMTEDQITELWKLADEPLLCFDGDTAGRNAAARAADRALPILSPGKSLRFVTLPGGKDPDDLIRDGGPKAMRAALEAGQPLVDFLWEVEETASALNTPERVADFHRRIRDRVRRIAARDVQETYTDDIERRIRERRRRARYGDQNGPAGGGSWAPRGSDWRPKDGGSLRPGLAAVRPDVGGRARAALERNMAQRLCQSLLATVLTHPWLLDEAGESLGLLTFEDDGLDALRQAVLDAAWSDSALDAAALKAHLFQSGYTDSYQELLGAETLGHASFARPTATKKQVRAGFMELMTRIGRPQLEAQLREAERALEGALSDDGWTRVMTLRDALAALTAGEAIGDG